MNINVESALISLFEMVAVFGLHGTNCLVVHVLAINIRNTIRGCDFRHGPYVFRYYTIFSYSVLHHSDSK